MTVLRLAALVGVVAALALLTPKVAPEIVAGLTGESKLATALNGIEAESARPGRGGLRQVALDADLQGHFVTEVRMNGHPVEVVVDTGASVVAINGKTARRLGIAPAKSAFGASIKTANGATEVAPVMIAEIGLGDIVLRDVKAVIIPGDVLDTNLLGMSFLGRLSRFEFDRGELVLTQ